MAAFRQQSDYGIAGLAYIRQMQNNGRTALDLAVRPKTPGFTAIGIFLFFGAITASLAATTLLWRNTPLDRLWALNPMAYKVLAPLGGTFLGFSSFCSARPLPRQESGGSTAAFGDGD